MKKYIIRFLIFVVAFLVIFFSMLNADNGGGLIFGFIARMYVYAPLIIILLLVIIIILLIKKK